MEKIVYNYFYLIFALSGETFLKQVLLPRSFWLSKTWVSTNQNYQRTIYNYTFLHLLLFNTEMYIVSKLDVLTMVTENANESLSKHDQIWFKFVVFQKRHCILLPHAKSTSISPAQWHKGMIFVKMIIIQFLLLWYKQT